MREQRRVPPVLAILAVASAAAWLLLRIAG